MALNGFSALQARGQDFEKGGGFFERVRQLLATLTRIFIVLESEVRRIFRPKTGDLKKKTSPPKLRRVFWLKSEIQTVLPATSRPLLHNFGT